MMKKNDWVATMLFNQPSSMEEVLANGITPENTGIKTKDYYRNIDAIKETFTGDDGEFNEVAFDNFYTSSLDMYNKFTQEEWTKKLIEGMDRDPFDWTDPLNTNIKDISATVKNGYNPERRSMSIAGIGNIGDPTFSIREIAQDNEVRDQAGNKLGWTPNQKGILSIFEPTVALATWDEDGTHMINGVEMPHMKGDYKVDENGDFFYEVLGKREAYDKEILRVTDTLTVDGSTLNKFDFFDSDGLTKSVGSIIGKTAMQIVPLLIPGVGPTYGTITALTTLASVLPTLSKAVNGIVGDNDSEFGQTLTQMENWFGQFKPSQSDKGKQSFFSLENIGEILTSSAKQLYQQKSLANLAKLINKNDTLRASNLGRKISLGYLALTASQDTYGTFKRAGASDAMAGIGMLASTAAIYGLMGTDYFRNQLFKGTFMDESEALGIVENYNKNVIAKIPNIGTVPDEKAALSLYDQFRRNLSDKLNKFLESPFAGKAQGLISKESAEQAWNTGIRVLNRSVNEGVEETMEEVVFDSVKAISAALNAMGIPVSEEGQSLDFGFSLEEVLLRWAGSFVGGFLGGAVFEGINTWEKFIGPKVVELSDKSSLEQMEYFIITGRTNELLDRAKVLYDKGRLGNKHLSTKTQKNSKGEEIYTEGTEEDNQNLAAYKMIVNQINYLDSILRKHNMHLMIDTFAGMDPEKVKINDKYKKEHDEQAAKQKELGIDSEEYTYKYKTNALLEVFNKGKFGSSYINEVVDVSNDIVTAESKLKKLTAKTDKDNNTADSNSGEIKFWTEKLNEALERRDDLMFGINTDKYIHQVIFANSPSLRGSFMADNLIKNQPDLKEIVEGAYWSNSIEGYVKTFYRKNYRELPKYERAWYDKEFNEYKKKKGDEQLLLAADLHYKLIQSLNQNMIIMEESSKDKTLDNYHNHGMLNSMDESDFSHYERLRDTLGLAKIGLAEVNNAFSEYVNNWNSEDGNIFENEKYKQFEAEVLKQEEEIEFITSELQRYQALYGENADTQESITELGKTELYDGFVNNILQVEQLESKLNLFKEAKFLEIDIQRLQNGIQEWDEYDDPDTINEIETSNANIRTQIETAQARIAAISLALTDTNPDQIREDINLLYEDMMNNVISYYNHLKDNSFVSENNFILKRSLNIIASKAYKQIKEIRVELEPVETDIEDDSFYKALNDNVSHSVEDYFNLLRFGKISEAVASYKTFISDIKQLFSQYGVNDDPANYVKSVIVNNSFGLDIPLFIENINKLISEIPTFSILDFLNKTEINVGEHVYNTIGLLEEEERDFIKSTDLVRYIINDPTRLDALKQIPRVLLIATSVLQNAYSGVNHLLNEYRKAAGKELLIETISDSTKDIAASHIDYLWQKAMTLITKHKINLERKSEFHKVSEVKIKTDFVRNLLFKRDEDDSFIKRLQTKFFGDLPEDDSFNIEDAIDDLIRKHHIAEDTAFTDFKTYNTFFIELCDLLYDKTHEYITGDFDVEVGKRLAELMSNDAYKLLTGKITDDPAYKLTEWSTIVFLGTVMSEKMSDMYSDLRTIRKSYPNIVPIIGQEWNIMLGLAESEHSELFNTIISEIPKQEVGATDQTSINFLKERPILRNFIFIQGGSGSGKTTVVAKFIADIIKMRDSEAEVITAGPETTQATNISNSLSSASTYTFVDLMNKIHPGWESLTKYVTDSGHNSLIEDSDINISTKADVLFNANSKSKILVLDEATFLSTKELQILTKWAKANNVKIIALGDRKQNGKLEMKNNKPLYSGIEDCIYISGPELTESLRNNNVAKANNLRDLTITIDKVLDKIKEKPWISATEVEDELSKLQRDETKLHYYDSPDTFVGERFVEKEQINAYVDKFVQLSTDLRKDLENEDDRKPKVLLITEDVEKHALLANKGVTILTPAKAQGGEYDYVIIDKDFSKNPSSWVAIRDFYTAISRSKYGSIIIGNEKFQNDLGIRTYEAEKSIVNVPLSIMDNSEDLRKWKDEILSGILEEEASEQKSDEKDDVENDSGTTDPDKDDTDEDDDENENDDEESDEEDGDEDEDDNESEEGNEDEEGDDSDDSVDEEKHLDATFDDGSKPLILTQTINRQKDDETRIQKAVNSSRGKQVVKHIEKIIKGKQIADRESFLKRLGSTNTGTQQWLKTYNFTRLFSAGVMFNLDIGERHIKKMLSIISPSDGDRISETYIRHIVAQWNTQKRKFVATPSDGGSYIYYVATYNGEEELIPITFTEEILEGVLTVDKYKSPFKQITIPTRIESSGQIALDESLNYGSVYSGSRICAPVNDVSPAPGIDIQSKKKCENFKSANSGKTFTLWSECDLFTDEDFEEMFKYQIQDDKFANYLNGDTIDDGFGNDVYQTDNGLGQAMLINVHRSINLSKMYDLVCIARYACGRIQYTDLTASQQAELGNIHDRTRAIKYMKGVLGNFGYNLLDETDAEIRNQQLATSLSNLKSKYRLLTAGYQSKILGELFIAFDALSKSNPGWYTAFVENVFLSLHQIPSSNRSKSKTYQNCLEIKYEGKSYLVKYRQDGFYDIYNYSNYKITSKKGEVSAKGSDLKFVDILQVIKPELTSKEDVLKAIMNKELSLSITKETYDRKVNKYWYDMADDYDYVYSLINNIPNIDLTILDNQIAKSQQFKFGFYLNDIGKEYQVGSKRGTNDSQQSIWRVNEVETTIPLVSKIARVEPSRFEIVGEFINKTDEIIDEEIDERESFENVSIISEVEKKLLSLCIDGTINVDPEELEDLIEKHKNNGVDENEIINNIINELSEKVGIEITWDFSSNEPKFGKDLSKDPIEKSITDLQTRLGVDRKNILLEEYSIPGDPAKRWVLTIRGKDIAFLYKKDVGSEEIQELDISNLYMIWDRVIFPIEVTKFTDLSWTKSIETIENDDDYDAMYSLWRLLKSKEKLINCK